MIWIVDIVAAILFVASGTVFFKEKFRRSRPLLVCAGLVALVSTGFLTWEISKLAVRSVMVDAQAGDVAASERLEGRWSLAGAGGCASALSIQASGREIALSSVASRPGQVETIERVSQDGWVRLSGAPGSALELKRRGDTLLMRIAADPSTESRYELCR